MKLRKILLFALIISLFSAENLTAQAVPENVTGVALSNQLYDFLDRNNFNPQKEYLVSNGKNNFPYNVIVKTKTSSEIKKNVIFVFNQMDAGENQELVKKICLECKENNFPAIILFTYGSDNYNQPFVLSGTSVFIQNELDTSVSSTAIIINLNQEKNSIISASNGKTSPSWLIKSLYNLIISRNMDFKLPPYYLSQLYTLKFSNDSVLNEFFNVDIPCVKLNFSTAETQEQISSLLGEIINLFNEETPMNFDQHFLILSLFNSNYFRMNEQFIVICVISIIFIFLVFIFLLFFIDSTRRNSAFNRLKNNWHALLFTFIIILASFLLGKGFFVLIQKYISSVSEIFVFFVFQIIISLIFCFAFFTFEFIYNQKISAKAVEYTVILSTFLNQFIFLYVDISLFPIFSLVCIFSVAGKYIKKNGLQIPVVIFMAVPFLIYAYLLLQNSQTVELKTFLVDSKKFLLILTLILCPIYLKLDCIFISFAEKAKNSRQIIKYTSVIVSIFCAAVILLSIFYTQVAKKHTTSPKAQIIEQEDPSAIILTYSDSDFFDEKVRSVSLKIPENTISCRLDLFCAEGSPVLYSDNTYLSVDENTAVFVIPSNPPDQMWFTFGTIEKPMTITATIIYPDSTENTFIMKKKTVKIDS